MTIAAIYARVSSARQKEEQTIASQTAALHAHAAENGLEVPPEWVFEDEGHSGATLIRPALERLRDLAAEVEVPVVLCYAPDRLARRYAYQALLIEEFARVGTQIRFLKGPKAETPEDELMLQFHGMIAEYERAQITERTRRGKLHRARAGAVSVLSGAPFGYRYIRKTEHAEARYKIEEREAAIVREIFRRYVEEHEPIGRLAHWLREQGIRTPRGKTFWTRGAIGRMLRNPAYCGRAAFGKRQQVDEPARVTRVHRDRGIHRGPTTTRRRSPAHWIEIPVPPIVSEEVFAQAARRLEENQRFASRRTKVPTLLQGLMVCERCGYSYIRTVCKSGSHRWYYYRCSGSESFRFEHGRVCDSRSVRQDDLDALVWEHVVALLAQPQLIRGEIVRRLEQRQSTHPVAVERARLERELSRTVRAKARMIEAYQEELITLEELRARIPDLKKKESTLQAQLHGLEAQSHDREAYLTLAENLDGFLARLRDAAQSTSVPDRQRIVHLLVKEVLIGSDRILIRHSIPVGSPADPSGRGYRLRRRGLVREPRIAEPLVGPGPGQPGHQRRQHPAQRPRRGGQAGQARLGALHGLGRPRAIPSVRCVRRAFPRVAYLGPRLPASLRSERSFRRSHARIDGVGDGVELRGQARCLVALHAASTAGEEITKLNPKERWKFKPLAPRRHSPAGEASHRGESGEGRWPKARRNVDEALEEPVCAALDQREVPHAVIGAAALAIHGVPRATSDLDRLAIGAPCLAPATWEGLRPGDTRWRFAPATRTILSRGSFASRAERRRRSTWSSGADPAIPELLEHAVAGELRGSDRRPGGHGVSSAERRITPPPLPLALPLPPPSRCTGAGSPRRGP